MSDFTDLTDLASERLGGAVLAANDEFFAPKDNLVKPGEAVFIEGKYTDVGKWMDGWETRRRREPGYDWCIVRLGLPGIVRGVIVDTAHFRGNFPESCSLDAAVIAGYPPVAELASTAIAWREILPQSALAGDAQNRFPVEADTGRVTHLRLNIYPDGGVARLRVHGEVTPNWDRFGRDETIDLAAVEHGGRVELASDMFFGNRHHLILPGPPLGMHDGWETRRRRGPGHDWAIVRLGALGYVTALEVDTSWFKGNAPASFSLDGSNATGSGPKGFDVWRQILPSTPLVPHTRHLFDDFPAAGPFSHVRLNIYPDGGVARLRVWGGLA
jgi:allantoicase